MNEVLRWVSIVLSTLSPVAYLAGLVVAIVYWRRNPVTARLGVAGLSCLLLSDAVGIALAADSNIDSWYLHSDALALLVTSTPTYLAVTGWPLLLAALFAGYRRRAPAPVGGGHR